MMFEQGEGSLVDFLKFDKDFKKFLPLRHDNIAANIDFADTTISLGVSKVSGISNAKVDSYTYYTKDQKIKFVITEKHILYIDENKYTSWENFSEMIFKLLDIAATVLVKLKITRTSIRFINKFEFDSFVPTVYFKTMVSQTEDASVPYPLTKYSFNLRLDAGDDTFANVNQTSDRLLDKYIYIFDIDVLNYKNLLFDKMSLMAVMDNLRKVKNEIFFKNITDKLIEKCN